MKSVIYGILRVESIIVIIAISFVNSDVTHPPKAILCTHRQKTLSNGRLRIDYKVRQNERWQNDFNCTASSLVNSFSVLEAHLL